MILRNTYMVLSAQRCGDRNFQQMTFQASVYSNLKLSLTEGVNKGGILQGMQENP